MIELIEGLPDGVVGLEAVGEVESADYKAIATPEVEHALEQRGSRATGHARSPVPTRVDSCRAGRIQQPASRDENAGPRPPRSAIAASRTCFRGRAKARSRGRVSLGPLADASARGVIVRASSLGGAAEETRRGCAGWR